MCFYYQLSAKAQDLESRYKRNIPKPASFKGNIWVNGFEFPTMPVITKNQEFIQFFDWGLIPHWAKDDAIKKYTLNARIETLEEKPSFREVIQQRCLIPATGFYEWQWLDAKGKEKQKYLIQNTEQKIFSFAGLYAFWVNKTTGETRNTFTIITTKANELMARIHNSKKRMPLIIQNKDEELWFKDDNYKRFAYPYQSNLTASII